MPEAPTLPETTTPDRLKRQEAPRLEVYVSSQCLNCDEAVRLAEEAAALFPTVVVRVIDLDLEVDKGPPPDPVVAVPTYVLNGRDRKSTRLNSSHDQISYAVFCLKKKKKTTIQNNEMIYKQKQYI